MQEHDETEGKWASEKKRHQREKFETLNMQAFISVILAAILLGFIVHEFFHIVTIESVSSVTIRFGSTSSPLSICCLEENESAMEELAYLLQLITTIGWIIINKQTYVQKGN